MWMWRKLNSNIRVSTHKSEVTSQAMSCQRNHAKMLLMPCKENTESASFKIAELKLPWNDAENWSEEEEAVQGMAVTPS